MTIATDGFRANRNMISRQKFQLAAIPVLTLMLFGCAMSAKAKHDRALARAKDLLEKKDYARAVLEARTAVQAMPKEPEGYYELGLSYAHLHKLQNAVQSYKKALALKPGYENAQVGLAEIMASATDPTILKQAQTSMSRVIASDGANTEAMDVLALTELKLGDTADAFEQLHQALTVAPRSLRSSILLAEAKMSQKDAKAAEDVLKQACQRDPSSSDARVALADFYVAQKRFSEAEQTLLQALKLNANNPTSRLALGKVQLRLGQKQEAEQTLRQLSLLPNNDFASSYGILLFQEGRRDEAIREFERLAHADANDRRARGQLVAAYWAAGRKKDAQRILDSALAKNPNESDALLQRAQMAIAGGNYKQAQSDANTFLHLNANSAEAHGVLANVYKGTGDPLQERQELAQVLRLQPASLGGRVELADLLVRSNGAASALKVLDEAPAFQKGSLAILIQRNWALMASGDMSAARKGIDAGLSAQRSPVLLMQDGVWKLQNRQTEAGRASLDQVLAANPQNVAALNVLYNSYASEHQAAAGVEKVKAYAAKAPHSPAVQEFLAQVLTANGDYDAARAAYASALASDPGLHAALIGLIQVDLKQGKADAAVEKINTVLAADPKDVRARLWLANVQETKGDHASALANYQQVVANDPKNTQALNNLAYLLVDYKKQPDAALQYAEKAQQLAPNNPDYADTVGWIFYQKGLYTLALKNFVAAAASPAATPVCSYHLAMAYAKTGQRDRGRVVLTSALKRNPNLPEASVVTQLLAQ
jgi:tetratricopeptide (TPR) repeat protein